MLDKVGKLNTAVMRFQVTAHGQGQWTLSRAKDLVVNETALASSKMLKNSKENLSPITKWDDASWHLKWVPYKIRMPQGVFGLLWLKYEKEQLSACRNQASKSGLTSRNN